MNVYEYKGIKSDGSIVEGEKAASSQASLTGSLTAEGLTIVFLREKIGGKVKTHRRFRLELRGVTEQDKITFARNLGKMINAGLSAVRALEIIEKQQRKGKFRDIIGDLKENVSKGNTLAESMKKNSDVFNSLMIAMVNAGEESGNLAESLSIVSQQMEESLALKKKVKGAMIYPGIILGVMVLIGGAMLLFVVPTISATFNGLAIELPLSTRLLIGTSNFIQENLILTISSIIITIVLIILYLRTRSGKRVLDKLFLTIPLIKTITRQVNAARTTRTLSSLLKSGVDFATAIGITRDVLQNSYYKKALEDAKEFIVKGGNISEVFSVHSNIYPLYVAEMSAVGEETGKISEMLFEVALYYEEEVRRKTKDMSTVVEPFLMVLIGLGVGFFAFSILSPMYSLADKI